MRRVVIFGAGGWIGSELCRMIPHAESVTREICDVTKPGQVSRALGEYSAEPLHVINATGRNLNARVGRYDDQSLERMLSDNLTGTFNIVRSFMQMKPAPGSSVIVLSSVVPRLGIVGTSMYSAVKSAVAGSIKALAADLAPDYRINCIELGYFDGGIIGTVPPAAMDSILDSVPLGRLGDSKSISLTCEYLMACEFATGGVVPLTGGL